MMDNMRDMKEKGRSPHGDKHSRSKLTAENVSRIKRMLAEDCMRMSEIAREFGVTHATISCIARGTTWRHVEAAVLVAMVENDNDDFLDCPGLKPDP
jgi:DNA invertase Pin-like site-specific DNA recombinase